MDWLTQNLPEALMITGVLLLIIEVAVLGFATFILLFLGLSLLTIGLLMNLHWFEATLTNALWGNVVLTAVLALLMWRPLKRMQGKVDKREINSDFADICFTLEADIDDNGLVEYAYSGIKWRLKSTLPLAKGTRVKIVKKEVGVLWVEALTEQTTDGA